MSRPGDRSALSVIVRYPFELKMKVSASANGLGLGGEVKNFARDEEQVHQSENVI